VVYLESDVKVEKSNKTTDTMNGTILVAANQKPASIGALEKDTTSPSLLLVQLS